MPLYNFGVGTIIGRRNGVDPSGATIVNPTPSRFGGVQDVDVSFDRTLKELIGQYTYPIDIAGAQTKITGKVKQASIQANAMNDMFFGQTLTSAAGEQMAVDEVATIATTITVSHAATFVHDMGVYYVSSGIELKRVASAPTVGQYSVVETTGVYTFNATDVGVSANICYTYTVTTMQMISIANQFMGVTPSFELHLQMNYPNSISGVVMTLNLKLNACKASKFDFPFKNQDHTLISFDFQAFADAANNVGSLSVPQ